VDIPIALVSGKNKIDLLSITVGLQVQLFLFLVSNRAFAHYIQPCIDWLAPPMISLITISNMNYIHIRTMEPFLTQWEQGSPVP
jgi:hypothetical protein